MSESLIPKSGKAEWHLTYRCDLRCVHCNRLCYLPPATPDMSLADAEDFCLQAEDLNWNPRIIIIGGEPTLHADFLLFVERAYEFNPGGVEIWSNGFSCRAKELLEQIRKSGKAIVNEGTIKPNGGVIQPAQDLFIAPADFQKERGPCQCHASRVCGISVDAAGYTLCASGGAIDGILGLGLRTRRLADLFDKEWAEKHTHALCRWCGCGLGFDAEKLSASKFVHGSRMSLSWRNAVQRIESDNAQ